MAVRHISARAAAALGTAVLDTSAGDAAAPGIPELGTAAPGTAVLGTSARDSAAQVAAASGTAGQPAVERAALLASPEEARLHPGPDLCADSCSDPCPALCMDPCSDPDSDLYTLRRTDLDTGRCTWGAAAEPGIPAEASGYRAQVTDSYQSMAGSSRQCSPGVRSRTPSCVFPPHRLRSRLTLWPYRRLTTVAMPPAYLTGLRVASFRRRARPNRLLHPHRHHSSHHRLVTRVG
jgi:hypothetical protein